MTATFVCMTGFNQWRGENVAVQKTPDAPLGCSYVTTGKFRRQEVTY